MHQIRECDSALLRNWADFEYSDVFRTKNHSLHTNFYPQFDLGWILPRHELIGLDAKNKNRVNGIIFAPKRGWLYAIRVKLYNPLLWMVARIVWYKIFRVGYFILSLLRLYLLFFVHLSTDSVIPWAKGVTSIFSRLKYFSLFIPLLLYEFT